jgi:hypothetical protein
VLAAPAAKSIASRHIHPPRVVIGLRWPPHYE